MNKCEYCKVEIERGTIRCKKCNKIWSEGVEFGEKYFSFKLKNILDDLKKLSGGL